MRYAFFLFVVLVTATATAQVPEFETTPIGDGVYRFRFRGHNTMFVVTDDGVVAFDPITVEAATRYVEAIREMAPGVPLRAIVYSHDHGDHAGGGDVLRQAFGGHVPIIAHGNAAKAIREAQNAAQPTPTITFDEQMTLHFGGRAIELIYLGKSHGEGMLVGLLPADRIAFAVDFASHDRVGYRDLSSFHFPDQLTALDRLHLLPFETIVFGHGPTGDKASIARQVAYYGDLRNAVQAAIDRGLTEDEAAEQIRLQAYAEWGGYEQWFGMNVRGVYRWLANEN